MTLPIDEVRAIREEMERISDEFTYIHPFLSVARR